MKRITFFIVALFALSTISAQPGQQVNQEEFSKFFEETIKPEVEKQQKEFFAVLTTQEKQELKALSLQADEILAQVEENSIPENRFAIHDKMMNLRVKSGKIAKAHPEQSDKYRKSMIENIEKWRTEMPNRNYSKDQKNNQGSGNGQGQGQGQGQGRGNKQGQGNGNSNGQGQGQSQSNGQGQGNRGGQNMSGQQGGMQMFQQLTDPAWLLLWSTDRNPQMMMYAGRNGMGMQNPMMNNPELKTELEYYSQQKILPEIAEKRKLFDKKLSAEEKAQIAQATGMVKTRDLMQKTYMESKDFDPGSRRNDPNFDAFKEGMQKNMMEIRRISADHADEIMEIKNSLKPQYDIWQSDIEIIISKYNEDEFVAGEMLSRAFRQNTTPMGFILFDSKNTEFWMNNRMQGNGMQGIDMQRNGMRGNNTGNRNRF